MMATPCRKIGCAALVHSRYKGGYCEAHQSERTGWKRHQQKLGNTTQRGYGHSWRKLRDHILHRDSFTCKECERNGRLTQAYAVDHIIPKAQGGTDSEQNLEAICYKCHKIKTQKESQNIHKPAQKYE